MAMNKILAVISTACVQTGYRGYIADEEVNVRFNLLPQVSGRVPYDNVEGTWCEETGKDGSAGVVATNEPRVEVMRSG